MTPESTAIIAGAFTTVTTLATVGVKAWLDNKRETRRNELLLANQGALLARIDANSVVNEKQIEVSNHVNEKLKETNKQASDSLVDVKRDIATLREDVHALRALVKQLLNRLTDEHAPAD